MPDNTTDPFAEERQRHEEQERQRLMAFLGVNYDPQMLANYPANVYLASIALSLHGIYSLLGLLHDRVDLTKKNPL